MFDFGLLVEENDNVTAVKSKIKEVEETFDLVLMVEHFDESIVLLKHLLCWEYSDLTSLRLNIRNEKLKSSISDKAQKMLSDWLSSDYMFYNHFKEQFEKKIKAFGAEKMAEEVAKFRAINKAAEKKCPVRHVPKWKLPEWQRPWGSGVMGFQMLTKGDKSYFQFNNLFSLLQKSTLYVRNNFTSRKSSCI